MMNDSTINNQDEEIKNKFFDAIKTENITEIVKLFRDESLKVWTLREEDEYTGIYSNITSI